MKVTVQENNGEEGMTVRQLIAEIRNRGRSYYGEMDGETWRLTDGTSIEINLTPASDSGYLMRSQRIERVEWDSNAGRDRVVRRYQW